MGTFLMTVAIAVAWIAFRLERRAAHQRDLAYARGLLGAVRHGIVDGWGKLYFETVYDDRTAAERSTRTFELISEGGIDQVFVVPTGPLEQLVSTPPSRALISDRTVAAASFALWKIGVFNQLVEALTRFNVRYAVEILDPDAPSVRLHRIAAAGAVFSRMLHLDGIGGAYAEGGWYKELVCSVDKDVAAVTRELEMRRSLRRYLGEPRFVAIDVLLAAGAVAALVLAVRG